MVALHTPYVLSDLFEFGSVPFHSPADALNYLKTAESTRVQFPNIGRVLATNFARLWDGEGRPYVVGAEGTWEPDREYGGEGGWEV